MRLGQDRLNVIHGTAPAALEGLELPDVVFIGGGLDPDLLALAAPAPVFRHPPGCQCGDFGKRGHVAARWHEMLGGELLRIELAQSAPLGPRGGWKSRLSGGAVERDAMIVAGLGFSSAATVDSLRAVFDMAAGQATMSPPWQPWPTRKVIRP